MKKRLLYSSILVCVLIAIAAFVFFRPIPLIKDPDAAELLTVRLFPTSDQAYEWGRGADPEASNRQWLVVTEQMEQSILERLGQWKERRTLLHRRDSIPMNDVTIMLMVRPEVGQSEIKCFYFGTDSFSKLDRLTATIIDGARCQASLFALLDVSQQMRQNNLMQ